MFTFILVVALVVGDKVPFDTFKFVAEYDTALECKAAVKEVTKNLPKKDSDRVFCIQVVDQSKWNKEI